MMKKSIITVVGFVATMGVSSMALAVEDGAGCGIGKEVLKGKSGTANVLVAAILNTVILPQSSSMTSGILGCDTTKTVQNEQDRTKFAEINYDNLNVDVAQGGGEHLSSLASIMNIAEEDRADFFSMIQANYSSLFQAEGDATMMLSALDTQMAEQPQFAKYVR